MRETISNKNLSDPACEAMWRLRAENVISVEDYEVLRDALYKLAEIEEAEKDSKRSISAWIINKFKKEK